MLGAFTHIQNIQSSSTQIYHTHAHEKHIGKRVYSLVDHQKLVAFRGDAFAAKAQRRALDENGLLVAAQEPRALPSGGKCAAFRFVWWVFWGVGGWFGYVLH